MSISHLPEVKKIHKMIAALPVTAAGRRLFDEATPIAIVSLHYKAGVSFTVLLREFSLSSDLLAGWKRKYGQDYTAYAHGKQLRYDVRTKCLAVKEMMETTIPVTTLATKYNVSAAQLYNWKSSYKTAYQTLIDTLPDGVPYLVKEEKMVFGKTNIEEVRKLLAAQSDALTLILNTMHMSGADKKLFASMKVKVDTTNADIAKAEKTFRDAGIIL